MIRYPLLTAALTSLTLLTTSSTALAGLLAPRHRIAQVEGQTFVAPPIRTNRSTAVLVNVPFNQVDIHSLASLEVLSPQEAIEKIQNLIEELILDDTAAADLGNQLLDELDDILDAHDTNADNAETSDALADIQDTISDGVDNDEIDANSAKLVAAMIEGVMNML